MADDALLEPNLGPPSVKIEELIGGMSAELSDLKGDLPIGRRHEIAAFESGLTLDIAEEGIYNPGTDRVTYPVMQPKYKPQILKGSFRDVFGGLGYARQQRDLFMKIAQRGNPVRISWADEEQQGILKEAVFGEESQHDITYTLTFFIAVPVVGTKSTRDQPEQTQDPVDILSFLRALAAEHQAELNALALIAAINAALSAQFDALDSSLDAATTAATTFSIATLSTPHAIAAASQQLQAACKSVQDLVYDTAALLGAMRAQDVVATADADSVRQFWAWALETAGFLLQTGDGLRTTRQIALQAVRRSTRLYRVQDGDTLESIAANQLGSKMRALELGITQAALVPGAYIRIPEAA